MPITHYIFTSTVSTGDCDGDRYHGAILLFLSLKRGSNCHFAPSLPYPPPRVTHYQSFIAAVILFLTSSLNAATLLYCNWRSVGKSRLCRWSTSFCCSCTLDSCSIGVRSWAVGSSNCLCTLKILSHLPVSL